MVSYLYPKAPPVLQKIDGYFYFVSDPNSRLYLASCAVPDALICLGNRKFLKLRPCNWTGGYKWTTALALSITLGGFGADR